jgi:hypothetical protein
VHPVSRQPSIGVAHIHGWKPIRQAVHEVTADAESPLLLGPEDIHVLFHQPINVVVLCSTCHTLYDEPKYTDVTTEQIAVLRDVQLTTQRAASAIRNWFCRGWVGAVGSHRRPNVINRWMPLLNLLKDYATRGLLPGPHRFLLSPTEMVDVSQALISVSVDVDRTLPYWDGTSLVAPTEEPQT